MPAFIEGFEYDVFISYRQNDNIYDGWVTKFVDNLKKELVATIKGNVNVYFDENPHDGLLETHQIDESLNTKLKCLIFIPVISQTYCDTKSFAWQNEFLVFKKKVSEDDLGMYITLPNGNVCSRILPVKIHNLDEPDQTLLEKELSGSLRSIEFIHQSPGVNRPLDAKHDNVYGTQNKTIYRDQINKVANSIKDILIGIKGLNEQNKKIITPTSGDTIKQEKFSWNIFIKSLIRRNIPQVILVYIILSLIIYPLLTVFIDYQDLPGWTKSFSLVLLIFGGVLSITLAWFYEFSPEGLIRTSTWESKLNPYPGYKKKPFTGVVTVIALIIILFTQIFYSDFFSTWVGFNSHNNKPKVIAVLPFENRSENKQYGYLSEALAEKIINQLSKVSELTIISHISTKQYTNNIDVGEIGKNLGVSAIVTGSYLRLKDSILISSELTEVKTKYQLWGEIYDGVWNDLFSIQSEMALNITNELGAIISETEKQSIEKEPTDNITAYDHYIKGRGLYNKYQQDANDSAILEFKTAIQLDSNFALAWAGLGDAYSRLNKLYGKDIKWNDSSIAAGTQAVKIDPNSSETYKALANSYYYSKQYGKAQELFEKSVKINPRYAPAVGNLASIYFSMGELYNALKMQYRAAELNPNSFIPPFMIGWTYRLLGDLDKSELWLNKSILIMPYPDAYRELGYTYVLQGKNERAINLIPKIIELDTLNSRNYEEAGLIALFANNLGDAQTFFEKSLKLNSDFMKDHNTIAPLALAYFMLNTDQHKKAINDLNRLKKLYVDFINAGSEDDDPRINMAGIMIMLDDQKEAINWISRAENVHWVDLSMIENIPWFEPIKSNPEYKKVIIGLESRLKKMRKKADSLD